MSALPRRFFASRLFWPLALLLSLAVVELGFRALLIVQKRTFRSENARAELARGLEERPELALLAPLSVGEAVDGALVLHPFLGFDTRAGLAQLDSDLAALREREKSGAAGSDFDLLLLGGASAERLGPHLVRALESSGKLPGRLHLWNLGRAAWKQPQQLEAFVYLASLGFVPDLVVCVDGWNELAFAAANAAAGAHPAFPMHAAWTPLARGHTTDREALDALIGARAAGEDLARWCQRALDLGLWRSALLGRLALSRAQRLRSERDADLALWKARMLEPESQIVVRGPSFEGGVPKAVMLAVHIWMRSAQALADACRGRSIRFVQVLEPMRPDLARGEHASVARKYGFSALLRPAGQKLQESGIELLDGAVLLATEPAAAYGPDGRVSDAGLEALARELAARLLGV